ncbi:MAG TPA: glycoside hydrolase family 38 C-terminal domain-containing protein [Acidobacteriaceae bacterium]|nr:glycoside hydrolase family 38 C-terminal domain-containing protein [Acidobacteriaceae bacterium]
MVYFYSAAKPRSRGALWPIFAPALILLKAAFPLAASSANATYDIPYGTIQRPTTRNNSYEKSRFEVPALLWADLGDGEHGFSLLNSSKYGYDAKANVLRLTLLRSVASPDPDADQGLQHFVYALYPHSGDWKQALTEQQGWDFNYNLRALQVERHSGSLPARHSFFAMEPNNVILTAVKKAEDGDALVLRFYEYAGKDTEVRLHIPRGATSAESTNLMEAPDKTPVLAQDGTVVMDVKPYSIDTVKVSFQGSGPEYWERP